MQRAFSLVEVLAAITIIGIITFLAIPNIVRVKEDGERNLAIARAQALNMGMASYVQANGQASASSTWASTAVAARYGLVAQYISYAPANSADYLPAGYSFTLPTSLVPLTNAVLIGPSGTNTTNIPY